MGLNTLLFCVSDTHQVSVGFFHRLLSTVTYFVKVNFHSFLALMGDSFINSIHVCCLQSKQYCLLMWATFWALPLLYASAILVLNSRIWGRGCHPDRLWWVAATSPPEIPGLYKLWVALSPQGGLFYLKYSQWKKGGNGRHVMAILYSCHYLQDPVLFWNSTLFTHQVFSTNSPFYTTPLSPQSLLYSWHIHFCIFPASPSSPFHSFHLHPINLSFAFPEGQVKSSLLRVIFSLSQGAKCSFLDYFQK